MTTPYREAPKAPSLLDDLHDALIGVSPEVLDDLRDAIGIGRTKVAAPHKVQVVALVLYVGLHQEFLEPLFKALQAHGIARPDPTRPQTPARG